MAPAQKLLHLLVRHRHDGEYRRASRTRTNVTNGDELYLCLSRQSLKKLDVPIRRTLIDYDNGNALAVEQVVEQRTPSIALILM